MPVAVPEAGVRAGALDLEIAQGATFPLELQWVEDDADETPIDLTGYKVRMMIRRSYADESIIWQGSSEGLNPTLVITNAEEGLVELTIPDEVTATFPAMGYVSGKDNRGVWDIEYENAGGQVVRLLTGRVEVTPEVTR